MTDLHPLVAFDFDSTLVSIESFDFLAERALHRTPSEAEKRKIEESLEAITHRAMNGEIGMDEAIRQRFSIVHIHENLLGNVANDIIQTMTPGISTVLDRLRSQGCTVILLSGGIYDLILPTAKQLGFETSEIFANHITKNSQGFISGYVDHPLCMSDGKVVVLQELVQKLDPVRSIMIGDGITDAMPWERGVVDAFIGVGIHVVRPRVLERAMHYARTIEALISHLTSLMPDLHI